MQNPSPGRKAQRTAKWARIMTKWLITYSHRCGAKWNVVDFCGKAKAESRGIVDLLAIRKNHGTPGPNLKRGDLFDIVLVQVKGGSASKPTPEDVERLLKVSRHHKAKHICLAEWLRGNRLSLYKLHKKSWVPVQPTEIFK